MVMVVNGDGGNDGGGYGVSIGTRYVGIPYLGSVQFKSSSIFPKYIHWLDEVFV